MKRMVIDGVSFDYIVRRTTKKKIYIRVKDGVVIVSATKFTTTSEIEQLLKKHILFIAKNLAKIENENVIHLNGIAYIPKFFIGKKDSVIVEGNEICITTKAYDYKMQKIALYNFYKREVEKEIVKIIKDAMYDFSDINFPSISVRYMKSMFGNYNKQKHHIKLSSLLAKYDYKYIKHVLYHELCHVTVFNHSNNFHALFESKYPNANVVRKSLKKIKYNDYI